jgi:hypothetical protein
MADQNQKIDQNYKGSMTGVTNDANEYIRTVKMNPSTDRVLVENSSLDYTLDSVGIAYYNSSSGTMDYVRADGATRSLTTIDYEHHEIHAGSSYTTNRTNDVGSEGTLIVAIRTPNTTKWLHLFYDVSVEGESLLRLCESPTIATGTALAIYNRDRNSTGTSQALASYGGTVTSVGTVIRTYHMGTGDKFGAGGASTRGTNEFILKQNTTYMLLVNNLSGGSSYTSTKLDWYEHTNVS